MNPRKSLVLHPSFPRPLWAVADVASAAPLRLWMPGMPGEDAPYHRGLLDVGVVHHLNIFKPSNRDLTTRKWKSLLKRLRSPIRFNMYSTIEMNVVHQSNQKNPKKGTVKSY